MRTVTKNMMQDTLWVTILQGLNYLIPLFVWPYLIVVLGASNFGIVGFSLALVQFLMLLVDFGFNLSATKLIATSSTQEAINRTSTDTFMAKLLLLIVAVIIAFVVLLVPRYAPYRLAVIILLPMLCSSVFSLQWLYQGVGKIKLQWIINSVCRLLIIPLTFVVVKGSEDVLLAVGIQSTAYFVSALVGFTWALYHGLFTFERPSWSGVRSSLKDSFPLFISTAMSSVYAMLLVVVLGYFVSTQEVGLYSAVEKIMRVSCYALLLPILQVCYPQVSKMAVDNKAGAYKIIRYISIVLFPIMLIFGCVLFFSGEQIMQWIGKDYDGSAELFRIMAFIPICISISGVCGQLNLVAIGDEKQKRQFRNVYIAGALVAVLSVACNLNGLTAISTSYILLITETVVALGMGYFALKNRP